MLRDMVELARMAKYPDLSAGAVHHNVEQLQAMFDGGVKEHFAEELLLKCPDCDVKPKWVFESVDGKLTSVQAKCPRCESLGAPATSKHEAMRSWNIAVDTAAINRDAEAKRTADRAAKKPGHDDRVPEVGGTVHG